MSWTYTTTTNPDFGVFAVKVRRGQNAQDVSYFRDIPTVIDNMTFADPFGDATAQLRFPAATGFDAFGEGDTWWLREFTDIDIYFLPATTDEWFPGEERLLINPMSQKMDLYLHETKGDGSAWDPVWEGFIVSIEPSTEGVSIQCQGCLYQLDYYYAKPLNPARPRVVEDIIERYMSNSYRGLRFKPLIIDWPDDWGKIYTQQDYDRFEEMGDRFIPLGDGNISNMLAPTATPGSLPIGSLWTGYVTRNYGSWEKALTGYIQGQLSYMYTTPTGGDTLERGDQWTITKRGSRQPVMWVRRASADPTVVAWYGQPGVEARLTRDGSQVVNVFFGDGKGANPSGDVSWNMWRQPYAPAPWCLWQPLAAIEAGSTPAHQSWLNPAPPYQGPSTGYGLYHFFDKGAGYPTADPLVSGDTWPVKDPTSNRDIVRLPDAYDAQYELYYGLWVSERQVTFPDGINEGTAREIAQNWIARSIDPGWQGTIDIKADLRDPNGNIVSKWSLRDGHIIMLKGFQAGDGAYGETKFYISQVQMNPQEGSVTLTVDTKFRDLLTVEEAIARGRDTLAPVKSLQVNRRSSLLNDLIVPWNPRQGSGYVPRQARALEMTKDAFPHSFSDGSGPWPDGKGTLQQYGWRPRDIFTADYRTGNGHSIGYAAANDDILESPKPAYLDDGDYAAQIVQTGHEALYVPIHSGSADPQQRWASVPILLSQAGTIMRSEFAVYDLDGNIVTVRFHVSIYPSIFCGVEGMPKQGAFGAFGEGYFQEYDPDGWLYNKSLNMMPDWRPIIGWGNIDQPAGYSPKQYIDTSEAPPTGLLTDGAPWSYNFMGPDTMSQIPETDPGMAHMKSMGMQIVSAGCMIYVDHTADEWTYVRGHVYRGFEGA